MSIPVVGVPIYNGTRWLKRQLDHVDYPVDNYFIINNGGKDPEIIKQLEEIVNQDYPLIKNKFLTHLPSNIGVAPAWNLIIKSYLKSPYWLIVNHDVDFTPGLLEKFAKTAENVNIGMIHAKEGEAKMGSYAMFLIRNWVIQTHGLFDENFYPAYCEDMDYIMRLINKPIEIVKNLGIDFLHGDTCDYEISGAQTRYEDEKKLYHKLFDIRMTNFSYMNKKWGDKWETFNPTSYPFNSKEFPIDTTTFDIEFAKQKYLP